MRPIDLLPPEAKHSRGPLKAGPLAYVVVGVLGLAVVAVAATVVIGNGINADKTELAELEARRQAAEQRVAVLAPYTETATTSLARQTTVTSLAESRFDWERVLQELAIVIPPDVWLTGINAGVAPEVETSGGSLSGSTVTGPTLELNGCGASQESVARLVASLKDIDGVTRVGLADSYLGAETATAEAPEDDSTADSGAAATTEATSTDCQTRSFIAGFTVAASFDAVTIPLAAPPPAPPAETEVSSETGATDDGGVADAKEQQQESIDSAEQNMDKADNIRSAVGVGG